MAFAVLQCTVWIAAALSVWFLRPAFIHVLVGLTVLCLSVALILAGWEQLAAYIWLPALPLMFFIRPVVSGAGIDATPIDYGLLMLQQAIAAGAIVTAWGWLSRLGATAASGSLVRYNAPKVG